MAAETRSGTLMGSYADALRQLGHEIRGLTPLAAAVNSGSGWLRLRGVPILSRIGAQQLQLEGNRIFTAEAVSWRPDILLATGIDLLPGTLATVKAATGCEALMLYPDTLVNLGIETIQSLPLYDLVAYACGRFGLEYLERLGARRTAWVPFAWDPVLHPRPTSDPPGTGSLDVAFAGEWRPDRERWLEALQGFDVGVWGGPRWRSHAAPHSVARRGWRGGNAWGADYARASRAGKITLNLVDITNGPGLNMRAFEAVGVGCFVLSTRTAALEDIFVEGEHIAYFDTPDELRERVTYYLANPDERHRIAVNAARLAESHTYLHRARELLALVQPADLDAAAAESSVASGRRH